MDAAFKFTSDSDITMTIDRAAETKMEFLNFIVWYGYDRKTPEYKLINFLVNDDEVKTWFGFYNGDPDTIMETTEKYKEYKLKKYSMDIYEFFARCAENLKDAMERLFMEECPKWLMRKLEDRLHSGQVSLELIYTVNKSDKWYNSLSKIVRSNF